MSLDLYKFICQTLIDEGEITIHRKDFSFDKSQKFLETLSNLNEVNRVWEKLEWGGPSEFPTMKFVVKKTPFPKIF